MMRSKTQIICNKCGARYELNAYYESQSKDEKNLFPGCETCGAYNEISIDKFGYIQTEYSPCKAHSKHRFVRVEAYPKYPELVECKKCGLLQSIPCDTELINNQVL